VLLLYDEAPKRWIRIDFGATLWNRFVPELEVESVIECAGDLQEGDEVGIMEFAVFISHFASNHQKKLGSEGDALETDSGGSVWS
jgi:hypothetical protein